MNEEQRTARPERNTMRFASDASSSLWSSSLRFLLHLSSSCSVYSILVLVLVLALYCTRHGWPAEHEHSRRRTSRTRNCARVAESATACSCVSGCDEGRADAFWMIVLSNSCSFERRSNGRGRNELTDRRGPLGFSRNSSESRLNSWFCSLQSAHN